jgi:small subunit ribosomal protein S13
MSDNIKQLVRVLNVDIEGSKRVYYGLRKIKGVSFSASNSVCTVLNIDKDRKIGSLNEEELKKIGDVIKDPKKYNIPEWILNRRKDYDTGEDLHLNGPTLNLRKEFDIKRLNRIKSYRGLRHQAGLPVRGQRTRSHFRKGKTVGVSKKKAKQGKTGK